MKTKSNLRSTIEISLILLKEQFREPISFIWILASPCALYYFQSISRGGLDPQSYVNDIAWFQGYVAITVSLFGFAYYLIGRRESGFMRSFAYHRASIGKYLCAHYMCFLVVAMVYGIAFYLMTKPLYGAIRLNEWAALLPGYLYAFAITNVAALLCSLAPWRFQTAGVIFSAASLALMALSALPDHPDVFPFLNALNPLLMLRHAIIAGPSITAWAIALVLNAFMVGLSIRYFRINPVWSRYA